MTFCKGLSRSARLSLAAGALLAIGAGEAAAESRALRPLPPAPALVALIDAPAQRGEAAADGLFPLDAPPVVQILSAPRLAPVAEPRAFDIAWEALGEDRRALALALDGWIKAARGADARRQRLAIAGVYAARGYAPLWSESGAWTPAALSSERRLREAHEDGLDLTAYAIPALGATPSAEAELALSEAVAAYAAQASGSRVDPQRISRLIGARPVLPETDKALTRIAAAGDAAGDALRDFNPPHYGYQALRDKLAELRSQRAREEQEPHARVAEAAEGVLHNDAPPAGRRRPKASAAATNRTEAEIIANMERWRWLPRDMGADRVEVNIPEFELAVIRNGEVTHHTRVIVGKEKTPTPIFSNALQFIIVNPYWNVPQSILNKEMLPKAGGDLSALEQKGFKVGYSHGKLLVRQPPGEKNALGRIKFMFPNDFAVYLHDTPTRNLFSESHRAFSHGCMRVDQPFALAEAVLGPGWSQERVRRLIGGSERYINLAKPLPIHIEYFTAYVDEAGRLQLRGDLYGYSARVRNALGLRG